VSAFCGKACEQQTAWTQSDFDALALWIPPGSEPDTNAIVDVLSQSSCDSLARERLAVDR
jgi:hypothetical protein